MYHERSVCRHKSRHHGQDTIVDPGGDKAWQLQSIVFGDASGAAVPGVKESEPSSEAETLVRCNQVIELQLRALLKDVRDLAEKDHTVSNVASRLKKINQTTASLIANFRFISARAHDIDHILFQPAFLPGGSFHTALIRYIELYCTRPENLVAPAAPAEAALRVSGDNPLEHIYWRQMGTGVRQRNAPSGARAFEDNYLADLTALVRRMRGKTLEEKLARLCGSSEKLVIRSKEFDRLFNEGLRAAHADLLAVWSHCGRSYGLDGLNPPISKACRFFSFATSVGEPSDNHL